MSQEYIFDPDRFAIKDPALLTDNYRLDTEKLLEYGKLATNLRQQLVERSESLKEVLQQQEK